jgi:MFS family permease
MLAIFLREREVRREHKLDLIGTGLLTASIALLLVAILEGSETWGWKSPWTLGLGLASIVGFLTFLRQQRSAPEPTLPLDLFRNRVIAVSSAGSVIVGAVLFTLTAFIPMYGQGVLGGTAAQAGAPLIAMSLGWPLASAIAGRLMMSVGYRPLVITGGTCVAIGAVALAIAGNMVSMTFLIISMVIVGVGSGFIATPYLVAVQNAVPWNRRGVATSAGQFFRTVGGAIAVAALGALLNNRLHERMGTGLNANAALDPDLRRGLSPDQILALRDGLGAGLHSVFVACAFIAVVGMAITLLFPAGSAIDHAHQEVATPAL